MGKSCPQEKEIREKLELIYGRIIKQEMKNCCEKCKLWINHDGEEPEYFCQHLRCPCHSVEKKERVAREQTWIRNNLWCKAHPFPQVDIFCKECVDLIPKRSRRTQEIANRLNDKAVRDYNHKVDETFLEGYQTPVKIMRIWAMPNKRTFTIKPIKELLQRVIPSTEKCLDPFPYDYSRDATDYLNEIENESFEYAVFDPPYSPRQLKECYKGLGEYDTKNSTWSKWKDLISKKVKKGGTVISFGWNSMGMGKNRGFEIIEILLVAHGGNHNDTIVVIEKKK